jgi:hypothetical protein
MAKEDVIYRKGMGEAERQKVREHVREERVKSHAAEGAFAGFMLFTVIGS